MNDPRAIRGRHCIVIASLFSASLALGQPAQEDDSWYDGAKVYGPCSHPLRGDVFARTELYFCLGKPDGKISAAEFRFFVDAEVTYRFPEGLTLLTGVGQFRNSAGAIDREGANLLILLYPYSDKNDRAIEEIRAAYKSRFRQASVLRVDGRREPRRSSICCSRSNGCRRRSSHRDSSFVKRQEANARRSKHASERKPCTQRHRRAAHHRHHRRLFRPHLRAPCGQ